jgi:hypothetical protein
MDRAMLYAAVAAGIAVASWHGYFAKRAIALFDANEPLTSWLTVALGPALTLAGSLLALFRRVAGGVAVMAAGFLSAAAFLVGEHGMSEYVPPYLLKFTLPMVAVGAALVALGVWRPRSR